MSAWFWLGLAVLALIGEIASGTFYLLVVSLGMASAALLAFLGLNEYWQALGCAATILLGVYILKMTGVVRRKEHSGSKKSALSLDIGARVEVTEWAVDGSTTVFYRGAQWQAVLAEDEIAELGSYQIKENRGNVLVLEKSNAQ